MDREFTFKAIKGNSIARYIKWDAVVAEFLSWADTIEITQDRTTNDVTIKGTIAGEAVDPSRPRPK